MGTFAVAHALLLAGVCFGAAKRLIAKDIERVHAQKILLRDGIIGRFSEGQANRLLNQGLLKGDAGGIQQPRCVVGIPSDGKAG
ncbi:hypothetical protein SDC9_88953 [bioreactor metagenome]|uniref:Uncharacterized protein n=1 Tax=bioreactor metagenome TaxID=1076179 RepID=A0A644ZPH4_9ZZZZ